MDNYDGFYASEPRVAVPKGEQASPIKIVKDRYTVAAGFLQNDQLDAIFVPEGSILVDAKVVISASLGITGIFSAGLRAHVDFDGATVAEDADCLVVAADGGGQAAISRMGAAAGSVAGYEKKIGAGGAQIFLTCSEIVGATGGEIIVEVSYANI